MLGGVDVDVRLLPADLCSPWLLHRGWGSPSGRCHGGTGLLCFPCPGALLCSPFRLPFAPGTDRNGSTGSQSNMQLCLGLNPTDGGGGTTEWALSSTVTNPELPWACCATFPHSAARNASCYQCHLPSFSLFRQLQLSSKRNPFAASGAGSHRFTHSSLGGTS